LLEIYHILQHWIQMLQDSWARIEEFNHPWRNAAYICRYKCTRKILHLLLAINTWKYV
jgi:hypothetical protein